MAVVLGLDAVLYRGTAGTKATTEVTNVKDLTINLESGEADVTTRAPPAQTRPAGDFDFSPVPGRRRRTPSLDSRELLTQ